MTRWRRAALAVLLALASPMAARAQAPAWEQHLVVWPAHAGEPAPWREDPRLAGRFHPDFEDDIQVVFWNPDSAAGKKPEVMWVRVLAHDSASDRFLGFSLNEPDDLRGVHAGDNVVFRWDAQGYPVALDGGAGYGQAGWPRALPGRPVFDTLVAGLRHYRMGNFGHVMPEIEACIRVLRPAAATLAATTDPAAASHDERFLTYYVLGRCLAEKYETVEAIAAFRQAIAVAPDSVDAHMGLLAELTVMVVRPDSELTAGTAQEWEDRFIAQRDLVARRFAAAPGVQQVLELMRNEEMLGEGTRLTPEQLAKRRRTTFALIRWKQR